MRRGVRTHDLNVVQNCTARSEVVQQQIQKEHEFLVGAVSQLEILKDGEESLCAINILEPVSYLTNR